MGMTENQLALVRYVAENNLQKAKTYALACCAEDTTQKNKAKVVRYSSLLRSGGLNMLELPANVSSFATMEDLTNAYLENRYYLSQEEKNIYKRIRDMYEVSVQLMEKHIPYRNATLLYGESGVGKTEFSKYVAYKLNLPYLYVNLSRMLDSYLGGTAKNLTALFEYIKKQKCVVMLDEIDSIASKRKYSDGGASAEVSRSTTCLLQLLDGVANDNVIIGATNLLHDVDDAVKRRFTEVHEIHRLTSDDNEKFIIQYMEDTGFAYDLESVKRYARENHSQSEITTHMIKKIAQSLIKKENMVIF